jgi:hypothetical protein
LTPWGIADLVGVSLSRTRARQRLAMGQMRPVASLIRAALLVRIPGIHSRSWITEVELLREFGPVLGAERVRAEVQRLEVDGFVVRGPGSRLRKQLGWNPLHRRLLAIELKLDRVEEARVQARRNLGFVAESFIALPRSLASRIVSNTKRRGTFVRDGIGVLGVTSRGCDVYLPARAGRVQLPDPAMQLYATDKFWRAHLETIQH